MRIAILTISDAASRGQRADTSGDAIVRWAELRGDAVAARALVPDESVEIVRQILAWCDGDEADLVLTTGGTGLSPRDVTPEATRTVLEREAPGIPELMRVSAIEKFPRAALSRGLAGTRNRTLVINLPGSPGGVSDALQALDPIVNHAVAVVRDDPTDHSAGGGRRAEGEVQPSGGSDRPAERPEGVRRGPPPAAPRP